MTLHYCTCTVHVQFWEDVTEERKREEGRNELIVMDDVVLN